MPNLENFLNKKGKHDFTGWEELYGSYGCQSCDENVDTAYFDGESMTIMWVCTNNHESKVELV